MDESLTEVLTTDISNIPLDIMVLGSGGREHALVKALLRSSIAGRIYAAPGNGGTAADAINVDLDPNDPDAVVRKAIELMVDLVVIGPEQPLVNGVADALEAVGTLAFGPLARGAQLEGSKQFAKEFMDRHGLPTATWQRFKDIDSAFDYLDRQTAPIVVKADGLAAGKGVTVAETIEQARQAVTECMQGHFGQAGTTVVIEECLSGPECSLLVFTDGIVMLPMAPVQDHKRAFDGDTGPNTGGMGVYSPVPIVSKIEHDTMLNIMQKAVDGLKGDGIDYRGVLYGGFMLTATGPKLLEFNARFGDPETQVILPRLQTDLIDVLISVADGNIGDLELEWSDDWAVCVVLASGGYPGSYETGKPISGLSMAEALPGVTVYHAGTAIDNNGQLVTAGGRVLNITATAKTFEQARQLAYQAASLIDFEGKMLRTDIGSKVLAG
jgi:phosphoribosylamine--glycine ligase